MRDARAELVQLRHLYFGNRFDDSIAQHVYRHEADAVLNELIRLRALLAALPEPSFCNAYQDMECAYCGAGTEHGGEHAPDCPWAVLRNAIGDQA